MLRCRMASLAPLQEVQQEIKAVLEKVSELETSLAAAKQAGDDDEVRFLRDRLVQLDRERVVLREKENKLMVVQSGGQHCLPRQNSHIMVSAHLVGLTSHTVAPRRGIRIPVSAVLATG